jgi:hypothetical protein
MAEEQENAQNGNADCSNPLLSLMEDGFHLSQIDQDEPNAWLVWGENKKVDPEGCLLCSLKTVESLETVVKAGFKVEVRDSGDFVISGIDRHGRTLLDYFNPFAEIRKALFDVEHVGPGKYKISGNDKNRRPISAYRSSLGQIRKAGFGVRRVIYARSAPAHANSLDQVRRADDSRAESVQFTVSAPDEQREKLIEGWFRPFDMRELAYQSKPKPDDVIETLRYCIENRFLLREDYDHKGGLIQIIDRAPFSPEQLSIAHQLVDQGAQDKRFYGHMKEAYRDIAAQLRIRIDDMISRDNGDDRRINGE